MWLKALFDTMFNLLFIPLLIELKVRNSWASDAIGKGSQFNHGYIQLMIWLKEFSGP